jgi:hypothetical protein
VSLFDIACCSLVTCWKPVGDLLSDIDWTGVVIASAETGRHRRLPGEPVTSSRESRVVLSWLAGEPVVRRSCSCDAESAIRDGGILRRKCRIRLFPDGRCCGVRSVFGCANGRGRELSTGGNEFALLAEMTVIVE